MSEQSRSPIFTTRVLPASEAKIWRQTPKSSSAPDEKNLTKTRAEPILLPVQPSLGEQPHHHHGKSRNADGSSSRSCSTRDRSSCIFPSLPFPSCRRRRDRKTGERQDELCSAFGVRSAPKMPSLSIGAPLPYDVNRTDVLVPLLPSSATVPNARGARHSVQEPGTRYKTFGAVFSSDRFTGVRIDGQNALQQSGMAILTVDLIVPDQRTSEDKLSAAVLSHAIGRLPERTLPENHHLREQKKLH